MDMPPSEPKKNEHPEAGMPLGGAFHKLGMITRQNMSEKLKGEKWVPKDFKPPCIGILHGIYHMAPVSQKDLAKWVGIDPSDIVTLVDQLENQGFVLRTRDVNDRRRQLLSLTRKGEEARIKLRHIGDDAIRETLAPLNEKEIETLRKLMERVVYFHRQQQEDKK